MAYYAYKHVRDLLPKHIIDAQGPDYEGDGNYDGDQWYAAEAYIVELIEQRDTARAELAKRDAEIAELKRVVTLQESGMLQANTELQAEVERLTAASVAWCELEQKL